MGGQAIDFKALPKIEVSSRLLNPIRRPAANASLSQHSSTLI
jgi:hypothetical protein